jgi:hypothetical protein
MAVVSANTFYEYTKGMLGFFDGSPITGTTQVPHPQAVVINTTGGTDTVIELSAVALGGINGLNN